MKYVYQVKLKSGYSGYFASFKKAKQYCHQQHENCKVSGNREYSSIWEFSSHDLIGHLHRHTLQ